MLLFTYPLLVFVLSLGLELIVKKRAIILLISFICCLIETFTVMGSIFLIYCFIYTFISLLRTFVADLIIICKNKRINHKKLYNEDYWYFVYRRRFK
ncbi:DUF2651 family protein [Clostridium estertheticum]|uniref:DUF2651 family protein n=1 Tax=Clostridium estertheticum TaxID=238834 RepID=UPI0013EE9C7F|nr:DUF2651 family protein [Clostridium estertheticum]